MQAHRPVQNDSGLSTPYFYPCNSEDILNNDACQGDVFCGNSRHLDRMLADRPDLQSRLPFEQQYCPACSVRDPRQQLVAPYELLGRERSWQVPWGRRIASCLAQMHWRAGVTEPKRQLGYGTHRYAEAEIDWRRKDAIDSIQAGLCHPITAENSASLLAQLHLRAHEDRELLVNLPASVHTNSLWNIETKASVIVRCDGAGGDRIELLNPRMDNCRRSGVFDPMQNIARYVFLEWATARFADDTAGHQWQAMIEGPWLLEPYFDEMKFSAEARRIATQRLWLWVDLENILYFYYFTAFLAEHKPSLIKLCSNLSMLDRITAQRYPAKPMRELISTADKARLT